MSRLLDFFEPRSDGVMLPSQSKLTNEFELELWAAYREAKLKYRFNATRFVQMMTEDGGVGTANRLLATGPVAVQTGLAELWQCGRLDLSVEAKVLIPKYRSLFPASLREIARRRLQDHEFDLKNWLSKGQPKNLKKTIEPKRFKSPSRSGKKH
jgi:hypothetical protein